MSVDIQWLANQFPDLSNLEQLPQSGQRWVFRCEHSKHDKCVLKLVKPGGEQYLNREIEAVRRIKQLSSSNVPRVYELGRVDSLVGSLVWLLEQYVSGIVLSEKLASGPLIKDELLRLAVHLVSAAADAESVEVVHRDIKPANIKIDVDGRTWLLDFGIARILDLESKTRTDAVSGPHSPGYSAPEQFIYKKRDIDGRSDLFAIGVVLYESATGVNPFMEGARDRIEILQRVENDPLPGLSLPWDSEGHFAGFVSSLTQKSTWQRPGSCAEALSWLKEIVDWLGGA